MLNSQVFNRIIKAGLVLLIVAAGLSAQDEKILSGQDLLRSIREKKGKTDKPAYSQRSEKSSEVNETKPVIISETEKTEPVEEKPPAPQSKKEGTENHPRSGNYEDSDVSIEKFFYMGPK